MKSYDSDAYSGSDPRELLTSPLGLADRLSAPRFRVDTISFADLGFICLLVLFLSKSFLFSPGIQIDLPVIDQENSLVGVSADSVATVWEGEIVTVSGSYPFSRRDTAFRELMSSNSSGEGTLLLLATESTSLEVLSKIYESAKRAGFTSIQMAAKPESKSPEIP